MIPVIDRVMTRIERLPESGCWIFMGALNEAGYGIIGLGSRASKLDRVHRVTYRHFVGDIPSGLVICHKCDVRCCCNPLHLFLGTHADNHADMVRKGRAVNPPRNLHDRGEYRYNAKLTEELVRQMRAAHDSGVTIYRIAKINELPYKCVWSAVTGKTWKHVND